MQKTVVSRAARAKPGEEKRFANLAVRMHGSLMDQIESVLNGSGCSKSEFVTELLQVALQGNLAGEVVAAVVEAKVRQITSLSRNQLVARLQAVENERHLLLAGIRAFDAPEVAIVQNAPAD